MMTERMGGRPRNFDTDAVLERALDLFWRDGYGSTSLQALLCHMGISRQSLYNTFGDKRSLFLAALTRYMERASEKLAVLEEEDASLPAIYQFFAGLGGEPSADSEPKRCCMVGRICMELGGQDDDVALAVQQFFARTNAAFEHALTNALEKGEVADLEARDVAVHLTGTLHGLGMMRRAGVPMDDLRRAVRVSLSVLEAR